MFSFARRLETCSWVRSRVQRFLRVDDRPVQVRLACPSEKILGGLHRGVAVNRAVLETSPYLGEKDLNFVYRPL